MKCNFIENEFILCVELGGDINKLFHVWMAKMYMPMSGKYYWKNLEHPKRPVHGQWYFWVQAGVSYFY